MRDQGFDAALGLVLEFEGKYAHDPRDPGGETYQGISRRYHPGWPGWAIIDGYKPDPRFPEIIDGDQKLASLIKDFYRREFWEQIDGDRLPAALALLVFDTAVNMGIAPAVKLLQKACNYLNGQPVLEPDGILGNTTLAAVTSLTRDSGHQLCGKYLRLREQRYQKLVADRPALQKFLKGWLRRLDQLRTALGRTSYGPGGDARG